MIQSLLNKINAEPVLVRTVIATASVILVQFGISVPDSVANAISGLIVAVAALSARAKVAPVAP